MSNETSQSPIKRWLMETAIGGASDLHLVAGYPPIRREHGVLMPIAAETLTPSQVHAAIRELCPTASFERFEQQRNLDFAMELPDPQTGQPNQRFRVNLFYSGESPGACIRIIPSSIPDLQWCGFPQALADRITNLRNGLVVFSGVTGSGKTTSMAMIIQQLALRHGHRIITIEDPIEYRFPRTSDSIITQRELGRDVDTFAAGLKYAMRQDPDIILVGEIRDQETARMALSAAETGHLVLTTLHTRDAKGAITRLVDLFPTHNHSETCSMLAVGLRIVVCQHLLPNVVPGEKRELALEVMLNTNPIAAAIRLGRIDSLDNAILTGRKDGMVVLDDSIGTLYREGKISRETAERFVSDKNRL